MKKLLILKLFIFCSVLGIAQVPSNISISTGPERVSPDKGSGILYFDGVPSSTPDITCCAEIAFNTRNNTFYYWNRDSSDWYPQFRFVYGYGVPALPPADSTVKSYIDLDTGKFYYNPEGDSTWVEQGAGGSGAVVSEISTLSDTTTISNPGQGDIASNNSSIFAVYNGSKWLVTQGGSGGVSTFAASTDTPNSYSGQAGKVPIVNSGETAIVFEDGLTVAGKVSSITDIPSTAEINSIYTGPNGETWKILSSAISGFNSDDVFARTLVGGTKYAIAQGELIIPDGYLTIGPGQDSTTRATNTINLLAAFNASVALNKPLILPDGVVECGTVGTLHLFSINQNTTNFNRMLTVRGGANSVISIPSLASNSTTYNIFNFGSDMEFDFDNFKISGPSENWSPIRSGTYSIEAGNDTLTFVSGQNFAPITANSQTDDHEGRYVTIVGAGPSGDTLRLYIDQIIDNNTVVLNDTASTTVIGAVGTWYGAWWQVLSQNLAISHNGNSYQQMGSGRSMTFYAGQKKVLADGFSWPEDIEGAFLYAYDTTTQKTIELRVIRKLSDSQVLINTEFNEAFAYKYVANTSDTYYQINSRCYIDNIDITGYLRGAISLADGAQGMQIKDSKISIFGTAIGTEPDFSVIPMLNCRFTSDNLIIDGAGLHYNGDGNIHPKDGNERVTYFGNGTSIYMKGGYIDGNYRTGISVFGGGDANLDFDRYSPVYIDGVKFGPRLKRSIQTGAYQKHYLSNMVLRGAFHFRGVHASLNHVDVDINLTNPTVSNIYTAEVNRPIRFEPSNLGYTLNWTNSELRINGSNEGFIVYDDMNSDTSEPEDRVVNFSNVNIYYNDRISPTENLTEAVIQLGDGASFNFSNVNAYIRTPNNFTSGYLLFREPRNIRWENSQIFVRTDGSVTRFFRIDDEVSDKILNDAIFRNLELKAWNNSTSQYDDSGTFGEIYRITNATNFVLDNVNRNSVSINGTSTISRSEILGDAVRYDNDGEIRTVGYGSGLKEAADLGLGEPGYLAAFRSNKLVEINLNEASAITSFSATLTDSTTISPNPREYVPVSMAGSAVLLTVNPTNLCDGCYFYVHVLDQDGNEFKINATGDATGYKYIDDTVSNDVVFSGIGRFIMTWDDTNNWFWISN